MQYVEEDLLEVGRLHLIVLQEVEAGLDEALDKVLFDSVLRPEVLDVFLKHILVELAESGLATEGNRVHLLVMLGLLLGLVFFGDSPLALGQICLLEVLKLGEIR